MKINKNSVAHEILIMAICLVFLVLPFQSAEAFWPFKKKPSSTPSKELTLILNVGKADLIEKMSALRGGGSCEAAALELALWKLTDLTSKDALDQAWKTFVDIEKMLLGGLAKAGAGEIWEIIKSVGKTKALDEFDEKMDKAKKKEKNENVVVSGKTGTGCEFKMTLDWFKQKKRVHVVMEGDCHCKLQNTAEYRANGTPVPLSKFRVEFDITYYYTEMEYSTDGETFYKVFGPAGGLQDIENPDDFPCFKITYDGKGDKESQCGCKNDESLSKKGVSAGPGTIKSGGVFAFVGRAMKKFSDLFDFGEKVDVAPIDNTAVLTNKGLSVDEKTLEEIIGGDSTSTTPPEEESEKSKQERGFKQFILEFLHRLKKRDSANMGPDVSERDREGAEEEVKKAEAVAAFAGGPKEDEDEDKKETQKTNTVAPQKPVEKSLGTAQGKPTDEKPVQKPIEEIPPEQDVCGDGKISGMEICDGSLFSKMCLDAVAEYKAGMDNPNLVPRCFNNCRGCEASVPGY